ncbi:aryl hydrocarbon receptor-like [Carcharodon carcharias]|uniref:aryl hydrocarbon receptor-like n=1 Tax=Carcharodon carcharias TaxID=13397 RepID=UPI001B7ECFC2|nr:aryl hydrocarbon receptor-like [Carcharodon carcharias]
MNSGSIYASRKRRKPVQKSVKTPASEGAKSNPSKRHRDRLNAELERLANLLPFPQDVVAKLDKLSVLRLSVSYLRAKSFFNVTLKPNGNGIHGNSIAPDQGENLQEGELLLQALSGFVLVITAEGLVFYASSTIQDYLGFHQSDIIHQSVFELIHTEDRAEFRQQLHWALNPASTPESGQLVPGENGLPLPINHYSPEQLPPENSPFLERNFVCRLRCLLDNSSGFLAMNFQGRLKFLYEQNMKGKDGSCIPPQLALFAIATPLQPPSILEIRTKNFIFRTKHKLDFTPMGCDAKGKLILGYSEAELCMRGSGYQFVHAADMIYCAENHVRMMKTGESGMTVFRLLTKQNGWAWVQANARLGYKNGKPDYIIATQRPLTEEEGEENLRKRTLQLPFNFATGEALLYEGNCTVLGLMDPAIHKIKGNVVKVVAGQSRGHESVDPNSLLGAMLSQDKSIYLSAPSQLQNFGYEKAIFNQSEEAESSDIFPSNWEEILFDEDNSKGKMEHANCAQQQKPFPAPEENVDVLANNIGSELYNTMKTLDIGLEDFDLICQDETFLRVHWDETGDINNIALNEEILTYVQESLKKRPDCMYSSCMQQKPLNSSSSCMMQQQLPTQHFQQQQPPAQLYQQQTQQSQMQQYHQQQQPPTQQYQQQQQPLTQPYQQQQQPLTQQYQQQQQPLTQQYQQQQQPLTQQYQQQQQPLTQQYQQQQQPLTQQYQQQQQPLTQQYQQQQQPLTQQYQQQQQPLTQQYQQQQQPLTQQYQQQQQPLTQQYQQQQQPLTQQYQQQQQPLTQQYQQQQQPLTQQYQQQQQPLTQQYQQQQQTPTQQYQQQQQQTPTQQYQQQQQQTPTQQYHQQQQQTPTQQYQQQQQQPPMQQYQHQQQEQQLQLCQKMKYMKVNGLLTNWNSGNKRLANGQEKEFGFSGLDSTATGFQYKSELNATPPACQQDFILYQQEAAVPTQHSNFIQTNMPVGGFHAPNYTTVSGLEDYLDSVEQHSEIQDYSAVNPLIDLMTPQTCYTGAMSMIPCLTENDLPCTDAVQLNPTSSGQQPFLTKIQTGFNDGNSNEVYPNMFNNANYAHLGPQVLHDHPIEPGTYSDQSSSGFM